MTFRHTQGNLNKKFSSHLIDLITFGIVATVEVEGHFHTRRKDALVGLSENNTN